MTRFVITILISLLSILSYGTNVVLEKNITGIILDAETKEPLEFATVSIYKDGKLVDGIITNQEGEFLVMAETGNYLLKIEYISYQAYETQIELKENLNLGIISLELDMASLGEVEIIAERSALELKLDKKVFNVGKDLLSQNGSLNEVLESVPSVSVDLDGSISLRGNSNVNILINGKPSVLAANNGLDQISAQSIERIEIITNPSARYQASGTAGIINIILKKNKNEGVSGSFNLSNAVRADLNTSLNLNYKTEKFNLFSTIGYRFVDSRREQEVNQSSMINGSTVHLNQTAETYRNSRVKNLYIGLDYFINDKNTITVTYYKTLVKRNNSVNYKYDYFNAQHILDSTILRNETYYEPQDYNQFELNFAKSFNKKGTKLTADFQYDFWDDDENETLKTQQIIPSISDPRLSRTRDIESSKDYLLQVDLINPINEKSSFEAGLRGETRIITSDYKVEEFNGVTWETFNGIANKVDYKEEIGGVYAQFSSTINKFSYQLGLRTEFSKIKVTDQENEFSSTKKYTKLFPTAHFTYSFTENTKLQLSYSRRINRPGFWYLNPFGGYAQLNTRRLGNPDLNPALTNSSELGVLIKVGKLRVNPSIYYQNTTDSFQFFTKRDEDGVLVTKPINLDQEDRIGLEISSTYDPLKWLKLTWEFNYFSFKQRGDYEEQNFDFDDSSWFTSISSRVKLPSDFRIQSNFRYNAKNVSALQTISSSYNMDLGLSKNILQNKATITFNIQNIFNSRAQELTRTGEDFNFQSYRRLLGPKYSLGFVYRFKQKGNAKNRRPGESNR